MRRQGVDTTHTHTVKATAHLVGAFVELAAGVEDGHHHLQCALVELLVFVHGDASAVVLHGDGVVLVDGDLDVLAVSGHRLVDRVVNGLVDQMVQTFFGDVANVHCRALAHCFKSFKDLNVTGRIVILGVKIFCHFQISVISLQRY